jgi:hypothetical protein
MEGVNSRTSTADAFSVEEPASEVAIIATDARLFRWRRRRLSTGALTSPEVTCSDVWMSSPVEAVQTQVDAYNARDAVAFTACYHPEATIVGPDGEVMVEGSEAINALYADLFAQSPDLHAEVRTRISIGQWVIDEEDASGLVVEGSPTDMHAVVIYRVSNGLIVRAQLLT